MTIGNQSETNKYFFDEVPIPLQWRIFLFLIFLSLTVKLYTLTLHIS